MVVQAVTSLRKMHDRSDPTEDLENPNTARLVTYTAGVCHILCRITHTKLIKGVIFNHIYSIRVRIG